MSMQATKNQKILNFTSEEDPIDTIVNSILGQVTVENEEELKKELYLHFTKEAFRFVLDAQDDFYDDPEFLKNARRIEDPDELIKYMTFKSKEDQKIAGQYSRGLFTAYYMYCSKNKIEADQYFKKFLK